MDIPLAEIKEQLLLNNYPEKKGSFSDSILFLLLLLVGALYSVLSILLLPFVLLYTLYVMIRNKK